ncbi:hypothetical protein PF004_g26243 [Phytophthora fragariae]|uniref:SWIM-type domain-containing protein n=1 Tax=Phytophthora fragariae TaxID=53985 RepID=A0A6G0MQE0_9STRA|nr:hypothetical protein PF004_g26243 [Phytophthora fragariae]
MAIYDLMEFSLCGTVGVVALVAALNALNYLLKWTSFGLETTVAIGCMGLLTHGWRLGDGGGRLRKMAPHFVVGSAWDSVLQQADDRDRSESASLLRLQEPDVEELEDYQAALDDPYPNEWTPCFDEASTDRKVPADFTRADVDLANTLTDLAAQASAIAKMAAQAQLRVRRGRQTSLVTETDKWVAADCDITPHAKRLFDDEMSHVAKLTVVPSKMPCFYGFDPFDRSDVASATTMYETNMSSGTCRPCKVAQQLQIPCRHIQAVIYSLEQQNKRRPPVYDVLRYFHPAYLVRTIHGAYRSVEIKLPVDTISTSSSNMLSAPLYRPARGSRKVKTADIQRGQNRIQSRGEEPKASRTRHAGSRGSVTVALVADEHDETPAINVFFESQLSAPSRKERADYHCTNCGLVGHNATLCTFTVHDVEEAGSAICPGLYVLGEPPLKICGVSATGTCEASEEDIN